MKKSAASNYLIKVFEAENCFVLILKTEKIQQKYNGS